MVGTTTAPRERDVALVLGKHAVRQSGAYTSLSKQELFKFLKVSTVFRQA